MDVFMLIATIIGGIICVIVNLYTIVIYCHKEDSTINFTNVFCKVLIMLSLIQIEFQPLFLLFDVTNSRQQST